MNSSIIIFVLLIFSSCGVKSPPKAIGEQLPSIDSIYMEKVMGKEDKKIKQKEK